MAEDETRSHLRGWSTRRKLGVTVITLLSGYAIMIIAAAVFTSTR